MPPLTFAPRYATQSSHTLRVTHQIRETLHQLNFTDIETPMLTRSTPEGARDYIVPSRTQKRSFFCSSSITSNFQTTAYDWRV